MNIEELKNLKNYWDNVAKNKINNGDYEFLDDENTLKKDIGKYKNTLDEFFKNLENEDKK